MRRRKNALLLLFIFVIIAILNGCSIDNKSNSLNVEEGIKIAVSIVPQETFVKAVGGDKINIITMIPPGKSPENFAPTPDIMEQFSDANLYFTIGVPTEVASIVPKIDDFNKDVKIVDMAEEVSKVYDDINFESGGRDPHIWLSPKRAKVMIQIIARELSAIDPSNESYYQTNAENYIKELDKLDTDIKESLSSLKKKTFICYHPAFGYFADDYNLEMLAIENEGKEATIEDLQKIIDFAKDEEIKVVFYQAEIDSKQSKVIASEIDGKAEMVEPLSPEYINNLEKMAETFKKAMEVK